MNILMLGWELPPYNSGGLGVACYQMSKALALQGARIDFVVPYTAKHPEIDFMKVHCAAKLTPSNRYSMGAYDSKNFEIDTLDADSGDLKSMRGVQRQYIKYVETLVANSRPDAIHANEWLTIEAGMRAKELTGAPLIVHVHATEFDRSGSNGGNPLVHEIEYQGLMMADRIIAVSQLTKDIIVDRYNIPADKVEVVHNAVELSDFNDGYAYDCRTYSYLEALREEGYTIVATVTRLTVQKGLTHFIRAAARASEKYHRFAFLIAGDGDQRDELVSLAADLGIADKLFFTGFVRGKQWRDTYSVADIFVMSSVSEPFGIAALEAAHHENALVITKQSGVGEVLQSILRYDFWDVDRLADQMIGIATSPALASSLKHDVKDECSRLSWHDVASRCLRIYQIAKARMLS